MATRVSDIDASEVAVEVPRTWRSEEAGKEDADWWKWVQRVRDLVRGPVARTFRIATPMIVWQQSRLAALHIDRVGIVSGDPPDDAWVAWI